MRRYKVIVTERTLTTYFVKADSKEEAEELDFSILCGDVNCLEWSAEAEKVKGAEAERVRE